MVVKSIPEKVRKILQKNKYTLLVVLIGVFLMLIPVGQKTVDEIPNAISSDTASSVSDMEERLARVLCQIEGAGDVTVLLMESKGEEIVFQTNAYTSNDTNKTDTVTVTDSDREESGLIKQVLPAQYSGAIVVCQGADDPQIRYLLTDAVSKATGLGVNKISVLKMK